MNVVPSVGPYPLMIRVPARRSRPFLTCATDSASPPIRSCFTPTSASGASSTTALNSDAVSHSVVTPSRLNSSPSSRAVGTRPGYNTHRPPCSNGPHSSSVDASNVTGASCRNTSSGPKLRVVHPEQKPQHTPDA